ncbi:MAG TPA: hypothetical protein VMT87_04720, partial [Vicinamibacteria bacterium]|nr:hypothetical protein [Vicinamibacteria bacterium]
CDVGTCPRCGGELAADQTTCDQCGHAPDRAAPGPAVPPPAPGGGRLIASLGCGMLAVMLALISIVVLFGLLLGGLLGAAGARA